MQTLEFHQYFAKVQDCKFHHLDCSKHNYWGKVLQNRTRSSSWNSSLFSNSLHQIPLHHVGWRYVSKQYTESISASPRTSSWYWNSKKGSLTREAFFDGHVISLILLSHKTSIVYSTITRQVTNTKSKNLLCETTKCLAISAESWIKPFGVNQKCNLRKQNTFTWKHSVAMFICWHICSINVIVALPQFLGREISNEKLSRHLVCSNGYL